MASFNTVSKKATNAADFDSILKSWMSQYLPPSTWKWPTDYRTDLADRINNAAAAVVAAYANNKNWGAEFSNLVDTFLQVNQLQDQDNRTKAASTSPTGSVTQKKSTTRTSAPSGGTIDKEVKHALDGLVNIDHLGKVMRLGFNKEPTTLQSTGNSAIDSMLRQMGYRI